MDSQGIDFLAIGDITTDAFIQLKDATVSCDINRENCKLCVKFGDKIPYEKVEIIRAVGNSPNAAVSASRLGLSSAILCNIGNDLNGKKCLQALKENNVITDLVKIHNGMETNYHYVLRYEEERTILVKHQQYPYKFPTKLSPEQTPKWIYLSSLAENSLPFHKEIISYIKNNPQIKLAFQPGTFQMKLGYEKLKDLYQLTELFFCNVEEAKRILNLKKTDIKLLLKEMHKLGPKIIVITDGPNGAYTYDVFEIWHMPMYPDIAPPVDRTGAGDAFASTFTSALALRKTIPEALAWGPINSMSVVQYVGAQKGLLTRKKLEEYLVNAPENYKPKKLN